MLENRGTMRENRSSVWTQTDTHVHSWCVWCSDKEMCDLIMNVDVMCAHRLWKLTLKGDFFL